jgi:hypothetical protein
VWAAVCLGSEHSIEEDFHGFCFARWWGGGIKGGPAGGQVFGTMAIGEEAIVSDPHEALGEHMEQKPTDEFLGG